MEAGSAWARFLVVCLFVCLFVFVARSLEWRMKQSTDDGLGSVD